MTDKFNKEEFRQKSNPTELELAAMTRQQRWKTRHREQANKIAKDYYHNNPEQKQKRLQRGKALLARKKCYLELAAAADAYLAYI